LPARSLGSLATNTRHSTPHLPESSPLAGEIVRFAGHEHATWPDAEIARRWLIVTKLKRSESLAEPTSAELARALRKPGAVEQARRRLADVSWFLGSVAKTSPSVAIATRKFRARSGRTASCAAYSSFAPLLDRLGIRAAKLVEALDSFHGKLGLVVGSAAAVAHAARRAGRHWFRGMDMCVEAFG
jgi:hypothetical protein